MVKRTRADVIFDTINVALMVVILIIVIYPLYFTLIASFSDPTQVSLGNTALWIKDFTLEPYANVFKNSDIWLGYRNTIFYTVFGTCWNLLLTLPTAYVLSKKELPGRSGLSWYFLFTMYFSGGLIPTYLTVLKLGLVNRPVTIVILGGLSIYNMIVSRIYFQNSIPNELYEAAKIDGASDFCQFFRIALPLSAPIIAVIALYYGVGRWNDYFTALIYLNDNKYVPLQIVLRNILIQNQGMSNMLTQEQLMANEEMREYYDRMKHMAEGMKYSIIYIASAPLLIAYPFVQKYFVKGVMIGSLKG
ncbi:MAG: carbohydrate ABC transporter permease [Clostridiaceae bacterium]|nr:carbohydrate ABC transporter permease [Clostridiales bacterium]MDD6876811.1 carbohydrate ABC transporter permease [Clostridiaceae bacterium]MDY3072796.1 carbohydrate ABC transporter permease [Eubacteriales bacterium]MDY3285605.1 carbohydrate ABC transporter permease [Eubacteriales bacterium]MDY5014818.1 carbohydrate ABC transporter permease [Eubacteriales bacterium]